MTDIFDDLGDDPFEPSTTPAPKKRGRPAGQTKPKAKVAAKPRWRVNQFNCTDLIEELRDIAVILEPQAAGNVAQQLKIAAELLELIENKKA